MKTRPLVITGWDESLWYAVIDQATITADAAMTFTFRNGAKVTV